MAATLVEAEVVTGAAEDASWSTNLNISNLWQSSRNALKLNDSYNYNFFFSRLTLSKASCTGNQTDPSDWPWTSRTHGPLLTSPA